MNSENSVLFLHQIVTVVIWIFGAASIIVAILIFAHREKEFRKLVVAELICTIVVGICLLILPILDSRLDHFREVDLGQVKFQLKIATNDLTEAHGEIFGLSNQVQQVSVEYSAATNDLAVTKKSLVALQPRHINENDQTKLFFELQNVPRANVVFNIDSTIDDAEPLANVLANVLSQRGFPVIGVERMTRNGAPANHGIEVYIIGQPDSTIATDVIDTLNSIGLNAHLPVFNGGFTESGTFSKEATNGVLYINIGLRQ